MILLHITALTPADPLSFGETFTWTMVVFAAVALVAWALNATLQKRPWMGPALAVMLLFLVVWSLVAHVAGPRHLHGRTPPAATASSPVSTP